MLRRKLKLRMNDLKLVRVDQIQHDANLFTTFSNYVNHFLVV
jgi:hypothetical protein